MRRSIGPVLEVRAKNHLSTSNVGAARRSAFILLTNIGHNCLVLSCRKPSLWSSVSSMTDWLNRWMRWPRVEGRSTGMQQKLQEARARLERTIPGYHPKGTSEGRYDALLLLGRNRIFDSVPHQRGLMEKVHRAIAIRKPRWVDLSARGIRHSCWFGARRIIRLNSRPDHCESNYIPSPRLLLTRTLTSTRRLSSRPSV
jgi:hypothetical protein